MLLEQIVRAQEGSSEDLEALVEKFGPRKICIPYICYPVK